MHARFLPGLCLIAAAALPAFSAAAQTAPDPAPAAQPAPSTEIEVRGKREIDKAIVADNIEQLTARIPMLDVVPRFHQPLCLHVVGPDMAANEIIAERITTAATAVGLKKPKPKCRENALVITIDEPQRLFDKLVSRRHWLVGDGGRDVSLVRLRDELASGKPAMAWNRTNLANAGLNFVNFPQEAPFQRINRASRMVGHIYRSKILAVVVFDATRIGEATPQQLGDYAAMHLLTTPNRDIDFSAVSTRSILSLFAQGPELAPGALTAFDRAYLEGVYAVGQNGWHGKVNRAVLDAYEAQCAVQDPEADCQFAVPEDALPQPASANSTSN